MAQVLGKRVTQAERLDAVKIPRRVKKQVRFYFKHHPMRFMFVGGEWLPQLAKLRIDPGVDGVVSGGGIDLAVAGNMRRGWQIIQPSDARLGEYQDYMVALPHEAGGNTYVDPFQKITVEAGRMFVEEGGESYYDFLRHLVTSGIVAPISDNIKKIKLHDIEKKVERLQGAVSVNPANQIAAGRLRQAEELLSAMRGDKPKPKRKKAEVSDVG
jgi:hypothetical protein